MAATLKLKPSQFEPGDVLDTGSTVLGQIALVKGGHLVSLRTVGGAEIELIFDGRRKFNVTRDET